MKTFLPKTKEIKRTWYHIDAGKYTFGRLCTRVASVLRGKHKATFTPHMDVGDFVVVTNAEKVRFTGRKLEQKKYYHYSGYPGGVRSKKLSELVLKNPERLIRDSVFHMLDDNRLRKFILRRLKVVTGTKHEFPVEKEIE
ncbi:MAG: 50S ribosomal protein L13 [Acidobacteriaceae bacterium]